jgi:predicted GIY-YIG superfamily endonuclease
VQYYYIIKIKDSLIKVGITKNLEQRLRAYRTSDTQLEYYRTYELDLPRSEVLRIEKEILSELKRWYTCRSETIESDNPRAIEMIVEGMLNG